MLVPFTGIFTPDALVYYSIIYSNRRFCQGKTAPQRKFFISGIKIVRFSLDMRKSLCYDSMEKEAEPLRSHRRAVARRLKVFGCRRVRRRPLGCGGELFRLSHFLFHQITEVGFH